MAEDERSNYERLVGVANFVPQVWSQEIVDYMKRGEAFGRAFFDGRECQRHEDWTSVYTPDDERFTADEATIIMVADHRGEPSFELRGRKTVKRWVPDLAAQSDLQTLLDKWRAEGKDAIADDLMNVGCSECGSGEDIFSCLQTETTEVVERVAPVEECRFYQAVPMGTTVNIPKYEAFRSEATTDGE